MTTEVRSSLEGVRAEWDALVDRIPLPSPFLRSWWLEAVAGPCPCFVLVFDGDRLIGGVALERDRVLGVERLRVAGFRMGADHLDLVADPPRVDEVVAALRGWFIRPGARVVELVGLVEHAYVMVALPSSVCTVFDRAPWSSLPGRPDEYFDERPRQLRGLVERPRRRLERVGAEHRDVAEGDLGPALERLRTMHDAQWDHRSEFLPSFESFARAARLGIVRRELRITELWVGDVVVAALVTFEVAGRLSYYQSGRDDDRRWRGAGTWLMALVVGDACRRGCREFDLLRGSEPYKRLWATDARPLFRASAAKGLRARLITALLPVGRRIRNAVAQRRR